MKKKHYIVVGKVTKISLIGKLDKGTFNMNKHFGSLSSGMLEDVTNVTVHVYHPRWLSPSADRINLG